MTATQEGAKRVLHVLGGMTWGGVETWLLQVLRHIDRERFDMDFLVHTEEPCVHDAAVRELGSRIIPCPHPSRPLSYARDFRRILRDYGPYDIVHSHVHHYSGYVLYLAHRAGVRSRIAHSHNDTSQREANAGLLRRRYLRTMEQGLVRYATAGLAASEPAARDLFGADWRADPRWRVLHYGLDLCQFQDVVDASAVRAELGIPPDSFVIGHVGRFVEQKNHAFLVDIVAEVAAREPKTRVLLVGDGPLESVIKRRVAQAGLADRVVFAGARHDVPRLMRGAMDVFLLPSLFEGLGLVLVEAQAVGLACVLADVVPEEADLVKPLMRRVSLSQPASLWAEAVLTARDAPRTTRQDALACVGASSFNIRTGIWQLERVYGV